MRRRLHDWWTRELSHDETVRFIRVLFGALFVATVVGTTLEYGRW